MSRRRGDPIMRVENLEKHYPITEGLLDTEVGRIRAVDGISFDLYEGETLGIVGESGCGKSTAATSMIRLEEPTGGRVVYDGRDVTAMNSAELKKFRRNVQMIFQDPDSSFDPRMNVGDAVAEPLIVQGMKDRNRRREIVADLLERVGLSADDMKRYPHEFSGGQKQRIALARALSINPDVIVADEPVSALDVSIQSEILALMNELQEEFGLTIVVISHNLGVVREICDRVGVMYLGEFVEVGPADELFSDPQHPYTRALLSAIPTPDPSDRGLGTGLKGDVPDPGSPPSGCRFHTRCPEVIPPEDLHLDQDVWRNVLHFRQRIRDGTFDLEAITEVAAITAGVAGSESNEEIEVTDLPADVVHDVIRDEYDLPNRLADPTANDALERALDALAAGDVDGAGSALEEEFVTPCELEKPELERHASDHVVACHLHTAAEGTGDAVQPEYEEDRTVSD